MGEQNRNYTTFSTSLKELEKRFEEKSLLNEKKELAAIHESINSILDQKKHEETQRKGDDIAALYDLLTKAKEFTDTNIHEWDRTEIFQLRNETEEMIKETAKKMTPRKCTNRLYSYSERVSDIQIISENLKDIIYEINQQDNWEEDDPKEVSYLKKREGIIEKLKQKILGLINGMKNFIGSAFEPLTDALDSLVKAIKKISKKTFEKVMEKLNFFIEKLNKAKLKLIEGMFGFIDEVVKLAKQKHWNVNQINMEMPDISINFAEINVPFIGIKVKIPLPKITQPKVTVTFTPIQ